MLGPKATNEASFIQFFSNEACYYSKSYYATIRLPLLRHANVQIFQMRHAIVQMFQMRHDVIQMFDDPSNEACHCSKSSNEACRYSHCHTIGGQGVG
jgi:hypothetical protein